MLKTQSRISDIISNLEHIFQKKSINIEKKSELSGANIPLSLKSKGYKATAVNFQNQLDKLIEEKSKKYGVAKDLISAMIQTENQGSQEEFSSKGSAGLSRMQPEISDNFGSIPRNQEQYLNERIRYQKRLPEQFISQKEMLSAYYKNQIP